MAGGQLVFITGGVRSGKSTFAEQYATKRAQKITGGRLHYVACGKNVDGEMNERIKIHQKTRESNDLPWTTWEQPTHIHKLKTNFSTKDVILIDCLTTLLGNELFSRMEKDESNVAQIKTALKAEIMASITALQQTAAEVIVVSNELLNEPLSSNSLTYTYAHILGHLHQQIVKSAKLFFIIEMGLPLLVKGDERHGENNGYYRFRDIIRCR